MSAQKGIQLKKLNQAKKKPKELAKSKEIVQILNEAKNKQKKGENWMMHYLTNSEIKIEKDNERAEQKAKKPMLKEFKRITSFKTMHKKMTQSNDFLMDLIKMTPFKRGFIQYYSNNKWKGRWLNLTRDCIIIEYPDVQNHIISKLIFCR